MSVMRTIGRAFPISKNQAKGYSYARPPKRTVRRGRLKRNPGVTHIAAINGRGAYSARSRMSGVTKNARVKKAKAALSREQRKSFKKKLATNSATRRKSSVKSRRKTSMRRNAQTAKQRAASLRNLRKARASRRKGATTRRASPRRRPTRRKAAAKRTTTRRASTARRAPARRRATTSTAKRRAAAKKGWAKRRRAASATPNPRRRTRRKAATANPRRRTRRKATANRRRTVRKSPTRRRRLRRNSWFGDSARHSAAAKKGWRRRNRKTGRRKSSRSRPMTARRRSLAAKKGWRKRKGMTANARKRRTTGKRRMRRNARMSYVSNSRRRRSPKRRSMRRNSRRRMRRNQGIGGAFRAGAFIAGGLFAHKVLTALVRDLVFKPAVEAVAPEAATEAPTEGLGQINGYGGIAVGFGTAVGGILLASKFIKNADDRKFVVGGIAASFLHSLIVGVADMAGSPKVATMLAGVEDGTAAKISAMYGFGAGTSIQPEYAAIRGMRGAGEYFRGGGVGEYFASGVQGLGAVQPYEASAGFGNTYGQNPDLYQAAAGVGADDNYNGNHIDPSSDLDRQLTIAEAAAGVGVGNLYQAAAGVGAANVSTVPRSSTWIPGMSDAPIWAGVKAIDESQGAHEMLTAGILQTDGGQGVFG